MLESGDTSADEHPWGVPLGVVQGGGALVIAGGGRLPEEVFEEFVRLAGGERARLVIIPTAHPFADREAAERAYGGWHTMGAHSINFVHAEDRDAANDEQEIKPLRRATGVWLGGGDQGRLADRYLGTNVERELHAILRRGGVIGGTSAGAAVLSRCMIREGTRTDAVVGRGFPFVTGAVIDQHFFKRQREPRLLGVLAERPELWGIGVDEQTALIIEGYRLRVVGASNVLLVRGAAEQRAEWRQVLEPDAEVDVRELLPIRSVSSKTRRP